MIAVPYAPSFTSQLIPMVIILQSLPMIRRSPAEHSINFTILAVYQILGFEPLSIPNLTTPLEELTEITPQQPPDPTRVAIGIDLLVAVYKKLETRAWLSG